MLEKVKLALRIKTSVYNTEIQALIDSCKIDLKLAGVLSDKIETADSENDIDPLIENAIILYCKAYFGYDDNADRFKEAYVNQKIGMMLSIEYGGVASV